VPLHFSDPKGKIFHSEYIQIGATDVPKWGQRDLTFTVPEGSKRGTIYLYLQGKGKLWFDDLKLTEVGKDTDLLDNGAFEDWDDTSGTPAGWRSPESKPRSALRVSPTNARAWTCLALAYIDVGSRKKACEAFERSLRLEPSRGDVWLTYARYVTAEGAPARTNAILRAGRAACPEHEGLREATHEQLVKGEVSVHRDDDNEDNGEEPW